MSNSLDEVMDWYRVARDSLRLATRVIRLQTPRVVTKKYVFHGNSLSSNELQLSVASEELDRMAVVALTAGFERMLRDKVLETVQSSQMAADDHAAAVSAEIEKDIEFWNISSRLLEVFPGVDPHVRGGVKQVIDYRNWVAHGQSKKYPAPSVVVPRKAVIALTQFLTQAGVS